MTQFTINQDTFEAMRRVSPDILNLAEEDPTRADHSLTTALHWLSHSPSLSSLTHLIESAYYERTTTELALLKELVAYIYPPKEPPQPSPSDNPTWFGRAAIAFIALAGTIWNLCDGFSSFSSLLILFVGLPYWSIFLIGFTMGLIPVAFFYGFDFDEISKNLNLERYQSKKLLDLLLTEAELIRQFRKDIKHELQALRAKAALSEDEKERIALLLPILDMLLIRQQRLQQAHALYDDEYKRFHGQVYLKCIKMASLAMAGLFFFCCGFFAGQTLALAVLASLAPTAWPIIITSVLVGVASFSVYWLTHHKDVERLVERWIWLDIDKINQLPDRKTVEKQESKRDQLKMDVHSRFLFLGDKTRRKDDNLELMETTQPVSCVAGI